MCKETTVKGISFVFDSGGFSAKKVAARPSGRAFVGLSMMCYTFGKADNTCLGDRQLSGLMGK